MVRIANANKRKKTLKPTSKCCQNIEDFPAARKIFKRLGGDPCASTLNQPIPLLALLLKDKAAFADLFAKQTEVCVLQLAAAAQSLLDNKDLELVDQDSHGLKGILIEIVFFASSHIHYERAYAQSISPQHLFAFGWALLCTCVRALILSPSPHLVCSPVPLGEEDRCYDEKAVRILICFVLTVLCANDTDENAGNKKRSTMVENEIGKQLLGDLDGALAFDLRRRFSDFLDEKFNRRKLSHTIWSLKPWNVPLLEKRLPLSPIDLALQQGSWDCELFRKLMSPLQEQALFTPSPLEWHYIPTRSLVPLSHQGPELSHKEIPETCRLHRNPLQPHEACAPIVEWQGDGPTKSSSSNEIYKAQPVTEIHVNRELRNWMNEVYSYSRTPPRNEEIWHCFKKHLGIPTCEMRPIQQLFLKLKGEVNLTKEEVPYLMLACTEAWCFVSEIFPPSAPPENVVGQMANLRRVLLNHRFVFYELLPKLGLDEVKYMLFLDGEKLPRLYFPKRIVTHFEDCADELACRTIWKTGSSTWVSIAKLEHCAKTNVNFCQDLIQSLEKIIHAVLLRGGKRILDIAEQHSIPYSVRYAAFDLFRHCVLRLPELLKDHHIDHLVVCSLHMAAKILREDYRLVLLADTCSMLRPHLADLYHHTWRDVPLVPRPFQLHHVLLKQEPSDYVDITDWFNSVFSVATQTMCCALTRIAHPNAHNMRIHEVALELCLLAPFTAARMTRTPPHQLVTNLLTRYRRGQLPVDEAILKDPKSLQGEVCGVLGLLDCSQVPQIWNTETNFMLKNGHFYWLEKHFFALDHTSRRHLVCRSIESAV